MAKSTLQMKITKKNWRVDEDGGPGWLTRVAVYFLFFFVAPMTVIFLIKSPYDKYAAGEVKCKYFGSFMSQTGSTFNKSWSGPSKMTTSELLDHILPGETLIAAREMECENGRRNK